MIITLQVLRLFNEHIVPAVDWFDICTYIQDLFNNYW